MSDLDPSLTPAAPAEATHTGRPEVEPWGFWATAGLGAGVFVAFLLVQSLVAIPFALMVEEPGMSVQELGLALSINAEYMAAALLATGVLGTLLILVSAWLRKGLAVRDYLALSSPGAKPLLIWAVLMVVVVVALEGLTLLLDRDVSEWMTDLYASAEFPLLLVFAVVVGAPLFEEVFFRGFLFAGWSRSKLGVGGTILLTSALWAAMHLQYGAYEIAQIFVLGVVLGFARHRSGSLAVPFAMHALNNLLASLQVVYLNAG